MYVANWIGALSIFICGTAAVFAATPTGKEDTDVVDELARTVARLQAELARVVARNDKLEAEHAKLRARLATSKDKVVRLKATTLDNREYFYCKNY